MFIIKIRLFNILIIWIENLFEFILKSFHEIEESRFGKFF
jgi:hypothetical protein